MDEIFKTIPHFQDYEISNFGRVRTKSRAIRYIHSVTKNEHFRQSECRFLKIHHNKLTGYKFCQLYFNKKMYNKTIHRLVAETFINNPNNEDTVNHIDGNKHNNIVSNLEWCSNKYNHEHAVSSGLVAKGTNIPESKLNDHCIYGIKYLLSKGYSHSEISRAFKISRTTISLISANKIWKHLTGEELKRSCTDPK